MLGPILGAGVSGLFGLAKGLLGKSSQDKANAIALEQGELNRQWQKDFAQNSIQWRVADAKAAGLHPLAALGAQTSSFSPVSVGVSGANPLADSLGEMGQNVGRAVTATMGARERKAVSDAMTKIELERGTLQNDLLRTQISSLRTRMASAQVGPPAPGVADPYLIPGQSASGVVSPKPHEPVAANAQRPAIEPGSITDVGYARTPSGFYPVASKDVKERIEDQFIPSLAWALRNNVLPMLGINHQPPPTKLRKGMKWSFSPWSGYVQVPRSPYSYYRERR